MLLFEKIHFEEGFSMLVRKSFNAHQVGKFVIITDASHVYVDSIELKPGEKMEEVLEVAGYRLK